MSRHYAEPVDVRRRDDTPVEFLWRGRLYLVRDVLAHWVEAGGWWRRAAPDAASTAGPSPGGDPARPVGALDDREREFWRVEARTGGRAGAAAPTASTGVFDLCFDWSAGGWSLARTHD